MNTPVLAKLEDGIAIDALYIFQELIMLNNIVIANWIKEDFEIAKAIVADAAGNLLTLQETFRRKSRHLMNYASERPLTMLNTSYFLESKTAYSASKT